MSSPTSTKPDSSPESPMGAPATDTKPDSDSVITLIQRIKDRKLSTDTLSAEDRRRCVDFLRCEGYSAPEIAGILKKHERTIYRDLDVIRATNALILDPHFVEKMTGELLRQAEISTTRLRKIAREAGASAMERLMAETGAWKVQKEAAELLQSLGYMPKAATGIVADIYQHGSADPVDSYDQLAARITQLKLIDTQTGYTNPERSAQLQLLLDEMTRGRLAAQVERAAQSAGSTIPKSETEDTP